VMRRRLSKRNTQPNPVLEFPLVSFMYQEDNQIIRLRLVDPSIFERPKRIIEGFEIINNPSFSVYGVNREEFRRWIEGEFEQSLEPELLKTFEHSGVLKSWFPNLKSLEVGISPFVMSENGSQSLFVFVFMTVRFSEGVPFKEFADNFLNFINECFIGRKCSDMVNTTIQRVITRKFPEARISIQSSGSPDYKLFTKGEVRYFNPFFVNIMLSRPLHEDVLNSLLNSSGEREFAFKFAVLIDPSYVSRVIVSHPGGKRVSRRLENINKIKELLLKISSFQGM